MKAYAYIGPFRSDFSTQEFVKTIKSGNINDFTQLPWNTNQYDDIRKIFITKDETLYLYGGREAVASALESAIKLGKLKFMTRDVAPLNLFRAQRTVARGTKSKNVFMLTVAVPDDQLTNTLRNRKVEVIENFESRRFKDLNELAGIIRNQPTLKG